MTPTRPAPDLPEFIVENSALKAIQPEIRSPTKVVDGSPIAEQPERNSHINREAEILKNGIELLGPLVAPLVKYAKSSVAIRNRSIFGGIRQDRKYNTLYS